MGQSWSITGSKNKDYFLRMVLIFSCRYKDEGLSNVTAAAVACYVEKKSPAGPPAGPPEGPPEI